MNVGDLFRQQRASGYRDFAGARFAVDLPVPDRLITQLIRERLPASAPVDDVDLRAERDGQLYVRARLKKASFLPPIGVRFVIERQPELPGSPVLVLRLVSQGIAAFAGPALRMFDVLPPGIRFDGTRFYIDLAALASRYGAADVFRYLTSFAVAIEPGVVIVSARADVRVSGG